MEKRESMSGLFATARIYCLISIVAAHLYFPEPFFTMIMHRLGTVGVVGFLVMAGYFYKPVKFGSFVNLLKKKAISIGVPWIAMGVLTWAYNAVLNPNKRSVLELIKWVLGNSTYLYYMPVLVLCFIIFYKHNIATLTAAVGLNIASVLLTATGVLAPIIEALHITNHLNVFNWIGFFAVGMLLQRLDEKATYRFLRRYRLLFVLLFIACYSLAVAFEGINLDYFSYLAIPYELIGVLALFSVSTFQLSDNKVFSALSESSFTIYLIHLIFIGLLDNILARFVVLSLLAPIVIIVVVFLCLMAGLWLARKVKLDNLYCTLLGVRVK